MNDIDREAAAASTRELRAALAFIHAAKHRMNIAAAGSDLCDASAIFVPLSGIEIFIANKIAVAEAAVNGAAKPCAKLRVVEGGKR